MMETAYNESTVSANLTEDSDNQENGIDLDQLKLIPTRPIESDTFLSFEGDPDNNQGQTAFFNPDPNAPDSGHLEISRNSPGTVAPYYATGRQSSPLAGEATRTATLDGSSNFSNFSDYLTENNIDLGNIGFSFGQGDDRDFTETYNAGDDLLGQDWLASPDSTIEERIYQADSDAIETNLLFGDTEIISFDYSPFYVVLDYGETEAIEDDEEVFFSETISSQKVDGLDPEADALADAFLQDIADDKIQLVVEDSGVENLTPMVDPVTGFVVADIPSSLSLRAVDNTDIEPSFNSPVFGTLEADTLEIEGSNNLVFAGEENDLIDASFADGDNRIYGDGANDTFILGTGSRLVGGDGGDRFFVTSGGDNNITGGAGEDQFWIADAELPESANIITDFIGGEDMIGIAGLGIGFEDLNITRDGDNALISDKNSQNLAILSNIDSESLNSDDFVFA